MIKASIKGEGKHRWIHVKIAGREDSIEDVILMTGTIAESVNNSITKEIDDDTGMVFARTALYKALRNVTLNIGKQIAEELENVAPEVWEENVHPTIRKEIDQFRDEKTIQAVEEELRKRIIESIMPKGRMGEEQE